MGSERRGGGAKKSKSEREDKRKTRGDREAPYRMEEKSVRKGKEGRRREANPAEGTQIIEGEHEAQEGLNRTERAGEGKKMRGRNGGKVLRGMTARAKEREETGRASWRLRKSP